MSAVSSSGLRKLLQRTTAPTAANDRNKEAVSKEENATWETIQRPNPAEKVDLAAKINGSERELYTYAALGSLQIRIFHLRLSEHFQEEIFGNLHVAALTESKDSLEYSLLGLGLEGPENGYSALSYAWGPTYADGSHLNDSIVCNGRRLRVTSNLKQALKRIRHATAKDIRGGATRETSYEQTSDVKLLWVDAICINQEDLQERSQQVTMMARIFNLCRNLIIWLGEPDAGELGVAQSQLLHRQENDGVQKFSFRSLLGSKYSTHQETVAVLQSIVQRPWFRRRWVIQEAAPEGVVGFVMLGDAVCPRGRLELLLENYGLMNGGNPLGRPVVDRSIFQTLFVFDGSLCEDPRDRVFAIKDLSYHHDRVEVNYNRDIRDVYLDLARRVVFGRIENDELSAGTHRVQIWLRDPEQAVVLLAISTCKKRSADDASAFNMESWLPDWTVETHFDSMQHRHAVEMCVFGKANRTRMELDFVPDSAVSRNGYCYFSTTGVLVKQHLATRDEDYLHNEWAPGLSASLLSWAKDMYKVAEVLAANPNTQNDRIWLPMAIYTDDKDVEGPRYKKTLALILRLIPEEYLDRPVYTLQTCMILPSPPPEAIQVYADGPGWDVFLGYNGYLYREAFCLR